MLRTHKGHLLPVSLPQDVRSEEPMMLAKLMASIILVWLIAEIVNIIGRKVEVVWFFMITAMAISLYMVVLMWMWR